MLPHQKIELGIYKRIKSLGPGRVSMTLPMLSAATGEDYLTIAERLKSLEAENRIELFKYSGGSQWPRAHYGGDDKILFHTGSFVIEIVPQARKYFEELEHLAEQEAQKQLVFISCRQCSPEEIQLGKDLAATVNELTSCQGILPRIKTP